VGEGEGIESNDLYSLHLRIVLGDLVKGFSEMSNVVIGDTSNRNPTVPSQVNVILLRQSINLLRCNTLHFTRHLPISTDFGRDDGKEREGKRTR